MSGESRVKKSLLNAKVNTICYFISLVVAFFSRKIFIEKLGVDFIGFTSTLQSLLGFLNLAELGIGTAIGYVLYKPIFDKNINKINEIISIFGYLYQKIGLIILGAGLIFSCFLPLIFPDIPFSWAIIYLAFFTFLTASLLGYFINYRQTLLSADQRNYEVTGYFQVATTTKTIIQMILVIYIRSYELYFAIELTFGIIYSILLNWRINKVYPWLKSDIKLGKRLFKKYPEIGKYVKQLFVHKIATFVQFQITPFLIYSYVALPIVALYGNYILITSKVQSLISGAMDSAGAGIGNLISEGNSQKILETYKELFALRSLVAGILAACVYYLGSAFIYIWLGSQYVLSDFVLLLISIQLFMSILRGTTDQFLFGYGLFWDIWAPAVESAIFIVSAIIFGNIWGLPGILCGPVISSSIIVYLWKPYFLFSKGFKITVINYWFIFLSHIFTLLTAYFLVRALTGIIFSNDKLEENWFDFILGSSIFAILMCIVSLILFYAISPGIRMFISRFVNKMK